MNVLNEHLLFSDFHSKRSLFSELVWNISEFSKGFLGTACSFHFGVTLEFLSTNASSLFRGFIERLFLGSGCSLPRGLCSQREGRIRMGTKGRRSLLAPVAPFVTSLPDSAWLTCAGCLLAGSAGGAPGMALAPVKCRGSRRGPESGESRSW